MHIFDPWFVSLYQISLHFRLETHITCRNPILYRIAFQSIQLKSSGAHVAIQHEPNNLCVLHVLKRWTTVSIVAFSVCVCALTAVDFTDFENFIVDLFEIICLIIQSERSWNGVSVDFCALHFTLNDQPKTNIHTERNDYQRNLCARWFKKKRVRNNNDKICNVNVNKVNATMTTDTLIDFNDVCECIGLSDLPHFSQQQQPQKFDTSHVQHHRLFAKKHYSKKILRKKQAVNTAESK